MRSHAERDEHIKLAVVLNRYLDPTHTFWTSIENRPISAISGKYQKMTGARAGIPDVLVLHRGSNGISVVFIELKSRSGEFTMSQLKVREELLAAGARWIAVRSWRGALVALARAGIPFRRKWQEPELPAWEEPAVEPKRLVFPPDVIAARRAAQRRRDVRRQARIVAARAAAASATVVAQGE